VALLLILAGLQQGAPLVGIAGGPASRGFGRINYSASLLAMT
jgi:hypothetical protein